MHYRSLTVAIVIVVSVSEANAFADRLPACPEVQRKECWLVCKLNEDGRDTCHQACHDIPCKKDVLRKCVVDSFWQKRLTADSSPFKALSDDERSRVTTALSKLPPGLKPSSLKAIVKASKPDLFSPANVASSSDEFIILYPKAFYSDIPLERIIFHEVIHELLEKEWVKTLSDYRKDSGWDAAPEGSPRSGKFIEPDGRNSSEEDLANNVEYFLFEPTKLRQISPSQYAWIQKKLSSKLKLKRGCDDGKNRKH